jgi:uncharacterized membrane protein YtjA (UPF0391 family)
MAGRLLLSSAWAVIVKRAQEKRNPMLHWSLIFLVLAIIAAILGFGGIAGTAIGIAKILFFVFLVLWIIGLIFGRRAV